MCTLVVPEIVSCIFVGHVLRSFRTEIPIKNGQRDTLTEPFFFSALLILFFNFTAPELKTDYVD